MEAATVEIDWPEKLADVRGDERKAIYGEYLRSDRWAVKRAAALARAGHACQVCNRSKNLHVHHRTYERIGREDDGDLTVLCGACHHLFHGDGKPRPVKSGRKNQHRRGRYSARHRPCSVCGKRWTTKGLCKPCRNVHGKGNRVHASQEDIERFADALNGKWKPTSRAERMRGQWQQTGNG